VRERENDNVTTNLRYRRAARTSLCDDVMCICELVAGARA
jgi:hypothetical protein